MLVEESFSVGAPADLVYQALNNVGDIGTCVAGVTSVTVVNDLESSWKVEQRFGFLARSFTFAARITDRARPTHIAFHAAAQDVTVSGRIALHGDSSTSTRCELSLEIQPTGTLAPLVELFAKGPQEALIAETIDNVRHRLEDVASNGKPLRREIPVRGRRPIWLARLGVRIRSMLRLIGVGG